VASSPLTIPQGATFVVYWDLFDSVTGLPLTSTAGFSARCQIRPAAGSTTLIYTFPDPVFTGSRVTFTAPDTDTAAMTFGTASYDVLVTDASGRKTRIAEGSVTLDRSVTV
jgi:hypothetical protein